MFTDHPAFTAVGADPGVDSGDAFEQLLPGHPVLFLILVWVADPEKGHALSQFGFSIPCAEDAIMPDFNEAIRQDVEEEAANELGCIQGHEFDLIVVVAISILEGHLIAFDFNQTVI